MGSTRASPMFSWDTTKMIAACMGVPKIPDPLLAGGRFHDWAVLA